MKLGAKGTGKAASSSLLGAVFAEDGLDLSLSRGAKPATSGSAAATLAAATAAIVESVSVAIDEKLVIAMTRDGAVESMEVKGTLSLTIGSSEHARCCLKLARGDTGGYQFQNHPNINKPLFAAEAQLALKATDREFPTGTPIGVLRWRAQSKDESSVPLTINCWPEEVGGGKMNVNLEYTLQPQARPIDLNNVVITIPLGSSSAPDVVTCDGTSSFNARACVLEWRIDMVSRSNSSGMLEFNVPGKNPDAFFPINVAFSSTATLCDLDVREITSFVDDSKIRFAKTISMSVESYTIQ